MFAFNDDHLSGLIGLAGFSLGGKSFLLGKNPAAHVLWALHVVAIHTHPNRTKGPGQLVQPLSLLLSVTRMFPPGQRSSWELVISSL